jgi:transcriptional regulator with XRE-family HTH domain
MTAKTSTKFASKPTSFNNARWATLAPVTTSSQSSSGLHTRGSSTTQVISPASQRLAGQAYLMEAPPLKRLRSSKPSARLTKLRSKIYRSNASETNAATRVAIQIRALREQAGMSQAELARRLGTRQSAVARLEDMNYGKQSIAVLHRIAAIFDVSTWVEFVSYTTFIRRTADLSQQALTPKPYTEEFDELGEPNTDVSLVFDGSVICQSNYVTSAGSSVLFFPTPLVQLPK